MGRESFYHRVFGSKPKQEEFFNPLNAIKGQSVVNLNLIDYRGIDFKVTEIEQLTEDHKTGVAIKLADYTISDGDKQYTLRCGDGGKVLLLRVFDQFEFSEEFHNHLQDALDTCFNIDDEKASFDCVSGKTPHRAVSSLGTTKSIYVFERDEENPDGVEYIDTLFIQQDDNTGWYTLLRGYEISRDRVTVY